MPMLMRGSRMAEPSGDPLSPLMVGATALHENLMSMVEAGFTREEGMRIVLTMLSEAIRAKGAG